MKPLQSTVFSCFFAAGFALLSVTVFAQTGNPNPGPRSQEQADLLWKEANETENRSAAIRKLKQFTDRYPRDARHLSALQLLTQHYRTSNQVDLAIDTARQFLHLETKTPAAREVRTGLAESYFWAGRFHEAKTTAADLFKIEDLEVDLQARVLLVQARLLLREKNWSASEAKLEAVPAGAAAELKTEADALRLTLGIRRCEALPNLKQNPPKTEDAWIAVFQQKLKCFSELLHADLNRKSESVRPEWCRAVSNLSRSIQSHKMNRQSFNPFTVQQFEGDIQKLFKLAVGYPCTPEQTAPWPKK